MTGRSKARRKTPMQAAPKRAMALEAPARRVARATRNGADRNAETRRSPAELARDYETVALALQGGGALGAYQAGVYEGLAEAGIEPDTLSGISIGAINLALIAGNAPKDRVAKLRGFWEWISEPALLPRLVDWQWLAEFVPVELQARRFANVAAAMRASFEGQRGFFEPRPLSAWVDLLNDGRRPTGYYDTRPLAATLERFVDFDRLNDGALRLSVGAVNVRSGNFVFFENRQRRLGPEHIMASGALPPGFPPVEIEGEFYWDGGIVSNTPLGQLLCAEPRRDTLAIQVDLWSARGEMPTNLLDVLERQKEILYSSRTRAVTTRVVEEQKLRRSIAELLALLPKSKQAGAAVERARRQATRKVVNVLHLIYQGKHHEIESKDYAFGPTSVREHWAAGLADMRRTLADPRRLMKPATEAGIVTHDIHRDAAERG
ncbi:MAG: patatin-like phospholipase family protein [Dongiaceae bacterium]